MAAPITTGEFFEYMEAVAQDGATTAKVQKVINRAWDMLVAEFGYEYAAYPSASAKVVYYSGGSTLVLPPHSTGTVTSVVDPWGTTVTSTQYAEDVYGDLYFTANSYPYGSTENNLGTWPRGRYVVTAAWGYGPATDAVKQLCLELAGNIWNSRDPGTTTDQVVDERAEQLRYRGGLTPDMKQRVRTLRQNAYGRARVLA